eukprot:4922649-Amphidinium_carterae.2
MVAVTNLGGLHGGCHVKTQNSVGRSGSPCPVRSVGKLDLHGRPDTSWTTQHVHKTTPACSQILKHDTRTGGTLGDFVT